MKAGGTPPVFRFWTAGGKNMRIHSVLCRVALRLLERAVRDDCDQDLLELYNEVKPYLERYIRSEHGLTEN